MIKNPPLASLAAALLLGLGSAQAAIIQSFVSNTAPGNTPGADMTYAADASNPAETGVMRGAIEICDVDVPGAGLP